MDANWHEMKIGNRGENTVILGVPVWGERLKEKLRQDVQHSASEQNRQSPPNQTEANLTVWTQIVNVVSEGIQQWLTAFHLHQDP